jgi:hypothetical protein
MTDRFRALFRQLDAPTMRGKFLSRVFGIFSEEIIRIWAADERAPYEDVGRPTLRRPGERGYTLDFTLKARETGKVYVAEMKCEIEYQNYRYLTLTGTQQLDHHVKDAFTSLLEFAKNPGSLEVLVGKKAMTVDGAILIWGAVEPAGRTAVVESKGFADVLAVASIIEDLQAWRSEPYLELVRTRSEWSAQLFNGLASADQ